jgi:hypothetical protein
MDDFRAENLQALAHEGGKRRPALGGNHRAILTGSFEFDQPTEAELERRRNLT